MPQLAATLLPVTSFVIVTEPIGEILREVVRYSGAVSDTNRADNHYRIVGGDRLQWSGRMRAWEANPRFAARGLANDIRRLSGSWESGGRAFWHGTLGRTVHRMPQIGEIERYVVGERLEGMDQHDCDGGRTHRARHRRRHQTWRPFAPYELVWAGGVPAASLRRYLLGRAAS
jgi:hypothetical protein